MNRITARPVEKTGSCPKRTSPIAGGPRGRHRSVTVNPETPTPRGAMRGGIRRPRTLLTAGGVVGRKTNSKSM